MAAIVVALALLGTLCITRGHTAAAVTVFVAIGALATGGRLAEWWTDRRREHRWRDGKRCSYCGAPTETVCADCRMDLGVTVYVCGHRVCRDMHELTAGCESGGGAS